MNIQEYIESGILELYAMGALSAAEADEVRLMIQQHPELKTELDEIETSLEQYAGAHARKPRTEVKQAILSSLDDAAETHTLPFAERRANKVRQIIFSRFHYFAAASISLILVSTFTAFYYYGKWRHTENQLAALQTENRLIAEQNNTYKTSLEKKSTDMAIMHNSGNMVVKMKGDSSSNMLATVYYDKGGKKVFLDVNNLPPLPAGKQYQLWAIVDAKPVDMGVFDVIPEGEIKLLPMKDVESPQAFAVTIEPAGGSPSPTSTPMMVGAAI